MCCVFFGNFETASSQICACTVWVLITLELAKPYKKVCEIAKTRQCNATGSLLNLGYCR